MEDDLVWVQAHAVGSDAALRPSADTRDDQLDGAERTAGQVPGLRGAAMTEDGSVATGEQSSRPPALPAECGVADRVDAAEERLEAASPNGAPDPAGSELGL
jgi:hypothetical protein